MSDNNGREWQILEKAVMASVDEQRKARRWGIVFKLLTFAYIFVIIFMLASPSKHGAKTELQFNDIINYYSKFLKTGEYQFGLYDLHEHYEMIMLPEEEGYQSFDYYGGFPDIIPTQKTFNDKTVESYKELIQNNATPTMVIFHVIESAILFILDGHHKFLAYGQLRKKPRAIVITNLKTTTMTSEQAIKLAEKMNCEKENYHNSIKSEKKNHYFDFKLDLEKTYDDINE